MHVRMLVVLVISVIASPTAVAGYYEYSLLDFSACKSYTLTSEWGDAQFRTDDERDQWYERDERTLKGLHGDSWGSWALHDMTNFWPPIPSVITSYMGVCKWEEKILKCDGLRSYPLPSLVCPQKRGIAWSRTCKIRAVSQRDIRIYGVDTGEHEDGSKSPENPYYVRDAAKFEAQCKTQSRAVEAYRVMAAKSLLSVVRKKLVTNHAYGKDTQRCLSYLTEGITEDYDKVPLETIAVRNECDRQDNAASFVARFLINPKSGEVFWLDHAKAKLIPYQEWLSQQQPK